MAAAEAIVLLPVTEAGRLPARVKAGTADADMEPPAARPEGLCSVEEVPGTVRRLERETCSSLELVLSIWEVRGGCVSGISCPFDTGVRKRPGCQEEPHHSQSIRI